MAFADYEDQIFVIQVLGAGSSRFSPRIRWRLFEKILRFVIATFVRTSLSD